MWYIQASAAGKETLVTGDKGFRLAVTVLLICGAVAATGLVVSRVSAQEEPSVGRYQFAAPDLVLDTATGRLTGDGSRVLRAPVDASGKEVGRYSVDGFVTTVARRMDLGASGKPILYNRVDLVKGYVLGDTQTGLVVEGRVYYSRPLQPGDL